MLDILQPYFSYNVVCICGIPSVTLEGTPADWQKLRQKVEYLAPFGLDWWLDELRPICDQLARAAGGDVDVRHWRRMYKIRHAYGAEVINGWVGKLFPYAKDCNTGKFSHRNPLLSPEVELAIRKLEKEEERDGPKTEIPLNAPGVCAEELPRGLSQVPFTLTDPAGRIRAMEFLAGPVVVTQDEETGALRPTLGWAMREAAPIEQAIARLADHGVEPAKEGLLVEPFHVHHSQYIPTDVVRFYQQFGGATIYGDDRVPLYRILPLAEWVNPEAQADQPGDNSDGVRVFKFPSQLRFAETSDGIGILITVGRRERYDLGSIVIGCGRDGNRVAQTGQAVAKSFSDFLLKALDGGREPFFRRKGI